MSLTCSHNGCGQKYNEDENSETACEYHPQGPIFHEGLKGWACCKKRVISFDDFLKIPGCTVGKHETAPVAPAASAARAADESSTNAKETLKNEGPKMTETIESADGKGKVEVYTTNDAPITTASASSVSSLPAASATEVKEVKEEDLNDPVDAEIAVGTSCKRRGCGKKYQGVETKEDECQFHSGTPIFHEGSKGYSCCSRKVLEFDEFLKIPGCRKGQHRFLDSPETSDAAAEAKKQAQAQVRHDFYQTQSTVHVTFYAKNCDREKSKVEFEGQFLKVSLLFKDGKEFNYHTPLIQPIKPEECRYTIFGTKVEVTLRKANGISWPTIEPTTKPITTWTTFGVDGRFGTIGGKEMVLGQDAPIDVARR